MISVQIKIFVKNFVFILIKEKASWHFDLIGGKVISIINVFSMSIYWV